MNSRLYDLLLLIVHKNLKIRSLQILHSRISYYLHIIYRLYFLYPDLSLYKPSRP
nr:MAG TPA: hypothetical protein [Bacteriophage sp.]